MLRGWKLNVSNTSGPPVQVPERRLLKTYAFDPTSTRLSGRYLTVNIAFEADLKPGPRGELLQVIDYDPKRNAWYSLVDLNDPLILVQDGLDPTEGDPRTHQQVVYAVGMSVIERFERHLGRRFPRRQAALSRPARIRGAQRVLRPAQAGDSIRLFQGQPGGRPSWPDDLHVLVL